MLLYVLVKHIRIAICGKKCTVLALYLTLFFTKQLFDKKLLTTILINDYLLINPLVVSALSYINLKMLEVSVQHYLDNHLFTLLLSMSVFVGAVRKKTSDTLIHCRQLLQVTIFLQNSLLPGFFSSLQVAIDQLLFAIFALQ